MKHVAVIDIGKTNAKLALVDLAERTERAVLTRPNSVLAGPPYPHLDTEGIWEFLRSGLKQMQAEFGIEGISITTHGACAALLAADGSLAAPVLDYEHDGPDEMRADYDRIRPPFAETGSPGLPMGLNLGAQFFWQFRQDPELRERVAHIVTWPQYWGYRLTGELASDLCSLGCHTDLWNPRRAEFSPLVAALGLTHRIAAPRKPGDLLGHVLPALAAELGLAADLPVVCGIHDSNASLLPHLLERVAPFTVISTGTWVIAMAIGGQEVAPDPARDTLENVNARGQAVPSARFMGGREFEGITKGQSVPIRAADVAAVLQEGLMLLPAVEPGSGPFQGQKARWIGRERTDAETEVAASFYLALMTAECLALIGAAGPSIVEGPFAANALYLRMLQAATGREAQPSRSRTGTSLGAALLFQMPENGMATTATTEPVAPDPTLQAYAAAWLNQARRA